MIKIGVMAVGTTLVCQIAQASFHTNDLYLGFTQSSAQQDYIIDLGQPAVVGVGGSAVVDLTSELSAATFNSVFSGGANGVSVAVLGGDNIFQQFGVFATQVRVGGAGNPAVAGSSVTAGHSSGNMSGGAAAVSAIMSNVIGGLPSAGNSAVDSTKSYTLAEQLSGATTSFQGKTGVNPTGTIDSTGIIYEDLYKATTASAYTYLGYFTVDFSTATPKLTFTPSSAASSVPAAEFSGTPTAGFAPLQVAFTDASTGSITNWVWNFGDGQSVTNTTSASVNHTYTAAGNYTVTLSVAGTGGTNAKVKTGYVVALPAPEIGSRTLAGGSLVFSGANCPVGVQYRILTSTNVASPLASWIPVATNTFSSNGTYAYTNSAATNQNAFFRLVSP